jgi:hypothetical protein
LSNILMIQTKTIFDEIKERMSRIESVEPFELIFYGSRARGVFSENSDYNFYLLASLLDHSDPGFITSISSALEEIESGNIPLNLMAGEKETFHLRVKILEPTSIHLCEIGILIYGKDDFFRLQQQWHSQRQTEPNLDKLIQYLENRYEFYKNLTTQNTKEEISRIEKILQLSLQLWVFKTIPDVSIPEIWHTDIPSRLVDMLSILYSSDTPKQVRLLVDIYRDIHIIKQSIRTISFKSQESLSDKLKNSISQINDLDHLIHSVL